MSRWVSYNDILFLSFGEQGWRSGESARLPPMWPGFDSGFDSGWVEFAVGSRFAPRVVLWVLRFFSLCENQHFQIPIDQDKGPGRKPAKADMASSLIKYCNLFKLAISS